MRGVMVRALLGRAGVHCACDGWARLLEATGGRVQLSVELWKNVVAPQWMLRSQRSWQVWGVEGFICWIDHPWHPPSVWSLMYDGGGGEGGTAPGANGGGEAHDEHQHSRLATEFDASQLKSSVLDAPVFPMQCIFPPW